MAAPPRAADRAVGEAGTASRASGASTTTGPPMTARPTRVPGGVLRRPFPPTPDLAGYDRDAGACATCGYGEDAALGRLRQLV